MDGREALRPAHRAAHAEPAAGTRMVGKLSKAVTWRATWPDVSERAKTLAKTSPGD